MENNKHSGILLLLIAFEVLEGRKNDGRLCHELDGGSVLEP